MESCLPVRAKVATMAVRAMPADAMYLNGL